MKGMAQALFTIYTESSRNDDFPVTLFYAFKQAEVAKEGLTSRGWATFLQSNMVNAWVRDRRYLAHDDQSYQTGTRGLGANALASSIVLVCRKRVIRRAPRMTRREFVAELRATKLPTAL